MALFGEQQVYRLELLRDVKQTPQKISFVRLLSVLLTNNSTLIDVRSDYRSVFEIIQSQEKAINFARKMRSGNAKYCVRLTPRQILLFALLTDFSNVFFSVMYMLWQSLEDVDQKNAVQSIKHE